MLRFQARQLLMEQLRRSVEQIDNVRRSPAQGVAELPRENSTPRKARLDRPAIERLNEFERDPELPVMRRQSNGRPGRLVEGPLFTR
jgi:hypothetical protein